MFQLDRRRKNIIEKELLFVIYPHEGKQARILRISSFVMRDLTFTNRWQK